MTIRLALAFFLISTPLVCAGDFPWIDSAGASGTLLLCGGEPDPALVAKFNELVAGQEQRILVVEQNADSPAPLDVLPGVIVHCGPLDDQHRARLVTAVTQRPERIGVCLASGAALMIRDRHITVLEGPAVTVLLAASAGRPLHEIELKQGDRHDLIMLRRAAIERSLGSFPPQALPPPRVEHGTLFIHGGGEMPQDVAQRFLDLAGGPDAPIVVLPIAADGTLPEDLSRDTRAMTRAGATNVKSLRARERSEVDSPEFAAALNTAKGVWFNGGRQWRFVDAYLGTKAEELFANVLRRGGVIGGSSAGASIQSQYMPRGSPLGNTEIMAEGYERGLGFLPGTAVDQHFTARNRHGDMTSLMRRYPQILGIGLDEGTAIVVQGSTAEVIGIGNVFFYDYRAGPPGGDRDHTLAQNGQGYDLIERKIAARP